MKKTYFKVVSLADGSNPDEEEGTRYYSAMAKYLPITYVLGYEIGQTTVPKTGRIFLFKSLETAKWFARSLYFSTILEGEATGVSIPKWSLSANFQSLVELNEFWGMKKKKPDEDQRCAKMGVLVCTSFTPQNAITFSL